MKLFEDNPQAIYYLFAVLVLLFSPLLACGISAALPTPPATEQPTESAPVKTGVVVVWQAPSPAWLVCNSGGLNVRHEPSMQAAVSDILPDGAEVVRIGDPSKDGGEVWQLVISAGRVTGYVDPQYLCKGE